MPYVAYDAFDAHLKGSAFAWGLDDVQQRRDVQPLAGGVHLPGGLALEGHQDDVGIVEVVAWKRVDDNTAVD